VQKVDGATLITLATGRNVLIEQLQSCGFETIADQLKLKRLVENQCKPAAAKDVIVDKSNEEEGIKDGQGRKLKMKEIKSLKEEDHHLYKMM